MNHVPNHAMLRENPNTSNMSTTSSPKNEDGSAVPPRQEPKTPLKKEDLEKIAKQLKHKLSKASITAKQSLSPISANGATTGTTANSTSTGSTTGGVTVAGGPRATALSLSSPSHRMSPLKYMVRKLSSSGLLLGSSPNGKSPTQMKTPAAVFLSSSPLKNSSINSNDDELDSPTKSTRSHHHHFKSSPIQHDDEPTMTLEPVAPSQPTTPPRNMSTMLKPSPVLQSNSSTPNLKKLSINTQNHSSGGNPLLRTPTQPSSTMHGDNEGADLLMYLATSPSPAKPPPVGFVGNGGTPGGPRISTTAATPKLSTALLLTGHHNSHSHTSSNERSTAQSSHLHTHSHSHSHSSHNNFVAPAPPLTPKRPIVTAARTPQNRQTPLVNLFNAQLASTSNNGLPSSGLMLTPAGFNMSDYFNFFTPLPGSGALGHAVNKNFLKTPDFNSVHGNSNLNPRQKVDGKMINFDKVGLFGGSNEPKE